MKKFVKYGTIAGGIMILAGTGITTAAYAMGANPGRITRAIDERWFADGDHWIWDEKETVSPGEFTVSAAGENTEAQDAGDGASAPGERGEAWVSPGSAGGFEAGYPYVSKLEVQLSGGMVEVYALEEIEELMVKSTGGSPEKLRYREGDRWSKLTLHCDSENYQIFIPEDWELESFEAKVQDGELKGSGLRAMETEIQAERGLVKLAQQFVSVLELEVKDQGAIDWTGLDAGGSERIDAECKNGSITMVFQDLSDLEYAGYDIECSNGTVTFPGLSLAGTAEKKSEGEAGLPYFELEADNGTITVTEAE